jgi:hypothetical protein
VKNQHHLRILAKVLIFICFSNYYLEEEQLQSSSESWEDSWERDLEEKVEGLRLNSERKDKVVSPKSNLRSVKGRGATRYYRNNSSSSEEEEQSDDYIKQRELAESSTATGLPNFPPEVVIVILHLLRKQFFLMVVNQ